jgi:hypothetical protein
MIAAASIGEVTASSRSRSFTHAADKVLCHIVNLVNAINRHDYAIAWVMACDLGRAVVHAESVALQMSSCAERHRAMVRLDSLRPVAMHALACAPRPSPLAIAQARSTERGLDRSAWASEEQAWRAARAAVGSLCIVVTHGDNLILRSLST